MADKPPRVRAYREFLTPLLHRRFVGAAFLATGICYAEGVVLSFQSSPWIWLPFIAVLRASLLFVPAIIIFLLRISQLRFGVRTSRSPFQTTLSLLTEKGTYQVFAFYFFSAWMFSEIHIHSATYEADLGWVANGELYERIRLNERVIYLRSHAFIVASVQSLLHLQNDYSCIRLPTSVLQEGSKNSETPSTMNEKLWAQAPSMLKQIFNRSMVLTAISPFIYVLVRPWAWSWSLHFARLVWNIPETSQPGLVPPFHWSVLLRSLLQGILLFGLSQGCNTLFSIFVAHEPTKNGKPLTSGSKDPNGSLINGLQSRKTAVRSYALWELEIIVRHFEERRRSILTEIDRKGQSAWSQVLEVLLEIVNGMNNRIYRSENPNKTDRESSSVPTSSLPRIATPVKKDSVSEAYKPKDSFDKITYFVDSQVRKAGAAPLDTQLDLSPEVRKYVTKARDSFLTKEQQQALSKEHLESTTYGILRRLLRFKVPATPFTDAFQPGLIFSQTFARQVKVILFGAPFSHKTNLVRAVDVLTALLIASVTEDTYGVVSKNVPEIWRALVKAVDGIEATKGKSVVHWTDVEFRNELKSDAEIEELVLHLKDSLTKLVETFSKDASARGLTPTDLKDARRNVGLERKY